MKFGRMAVAVAEGAILAHSVKGPGLVLRKGEVIQAPHVAALEAAGVISVVGAMLEPGDVVEDVAAERLARAVAGEHTKLEKPFTGRCNLLAERAGLVIVDAPMVHAVNARDEAITIATAPPYQPVQAGEMIATIKIIPFAVRDECLESVLSAVTKSAVSLRPFLPLRVGVVSTMLPNLKASTITKTLRVLQDRLDLAGATIGVERRVPHDVEALSEAVAAVARDVDLLVVFGASAITDRRDVVPVSIEVAGGRVDHLGMPVDPGNLLLLGRLPVRDRAVIPVIGAPGCARSPKENGFDFVLRRLLAGIPVSGQDLRGMGVGGLLTEIASRPQLRQPPGE